MRVTSSSMRCWNCSTWAAKRVRASVSRTASRVNSLCSGNQRRPKGVSAAKTSRRGLEVEGVRRLGVHGGGDLGEHEVGLAAAYASKKSSSMRGEVGVEGAAGEAGGADQVVDGDPPKGLSAKTSTAASTRRARVFSRLRRGAERGRAVVIGRSSRMAPLGVTQVTARLDTLLYSIQFAYSNMSSFLFRLGLVVARRARSVVAAWLLAARRRGGPRRPGSVGSCSDDLTIPGTESQEGSTSSTPGSPRWPAPPARSCSSRPRASAITAYRGDDREPGRRRSRDVDARPVRLRPVRAEEPATCRSPRTAATRSSQVQLDDPARAGRRPSSRDAIDEAATGAARIARLERRTSGGRCSPRRRRRSPPTEAIGVLVVALVVLVVTFGSLRRGRHAAGHRGPRGRGHDGRVLLRSRRFTADQLLHPDAGADDRPGRRHRLRAVHRLPAPRPARRAAWRSRSRSPGPSPPPAARSSSPASRWSSRCAAGRRADPVPGRDGLRRRGRRRRRGRHRAHLVPAAARLSPASGCARAARSPRSARERRRRAGETARSATRWVALVTRRPAVTTVRRCRRAAPAGPPRQGPRPRPARQRLGASPARSERRHLRPDQRGLRPRLQRPAAGHRRHHPHHASPIG